MFVKLDKEEPVVMSFHSEQITNFNLIAFHFASAMMAQVRPSR